MVFFFSFYFQKPTWAYLCVCVWVSRILPEKKKQQKDTKKKIAGDERWRTPSAITQDGNAAKCCEPFRVSLAHHGMPTGHISTSLALPVCAPVVQVCAPTTAAMRRHRCELNSLTNQQKNPQKTFKKGFVCCKIQL